LRVKLQGGGNEGRGRNRLRMGAGTFLWKKQRAVEKSLGAKKTGAASRPCGNSTRKKTGRVPATKARV